MKIKTLLFASLLLALMAGNAKAQSIVLLNQGFEETDDLTDWKFNGIEIQIGESVPYGAIAEDIYNTGYNSFHFGNNMSDYGYLVSPELTGKDPDKGVGVTFYYTNYYKDCASEFKVGYSTTTADPNAFTWGEMVTASNGKYDSDLHTGGPDWKPYVNSFPADAKYIAIAKVIGGFHLFVDDIVLSETDCAMPSIPVVTNVASNAITVEWSGFAQGLKCSSMQDYGFEDEDEEFDGWTMLGGENCWWSGDDASGHNSMYCLLSDVIDLGEDNYLVSPEMQLGGRVTFYAKGVEVEGGSFKGHHRDGDYNLNFKVMVTTAEEPDVDDFVPVTDAEYEASIEGWVRYSVDLSEYSGLGHVAICHVYNENEGEKGVKDGEEEETYLLAIDDITLYTPVVENHELTENPFTISGLDAMTKYAIQLQGCENQWTGPLYVATLPEDEIDSYEFVQDGYWNEVTNWKNWYMPQSEDDDVIIKAYARIPSNYVAKAGTITIDNDGGSHPVYYGSITIADGGQLMHNNDDLVVTAEKNIIGYTDEEAKDHYYLLASPVGAKPNTVDNLLENDYDLYKFDQYADHEWQNYEIDDETSAENFVLTYPEGFLYANSNNVTLRFTGEIESSEEGFPTSLEYADTEVEFRGWNLVGNPFMCNAYIGRPFYRLTPDSDELVAASATDAIAPLEGVFVQAEDADDAEDGITFSREPARKGSVLNVNVFRSEANVDVARVRFGEGHSLEKIQLNPSHTKVYFPQNGKNYAVVNANGIGELPCNFKAEEDGIYTLSFTKEQVEFNYLHLIDNMTGADIDLLKYPEYTFQAKNDDYASRFRVVFVAKDTEGIAEDSETFAFNSYGSWIIVNEGLATLQMVDINGRVLRNEQIEGYTSMKFNVAPGVYVLRLVNGENVRVQKVVVR